jgi:hypothetical protein
MLRSAEPDVSDQTQTNRRGAEPAVPARSRRRWPHVLLGAGLALLAAAGAAVAVLRWPPARQYVAAELADREPYDWPDRTDVGLRQSLLRTRDHALARGDLETAALLHAGLAQEALLRARTVHDAWMARRHPVTKLFPRGPKSSAWNYRDTAADFFGFQLHAGLRLRPESMPALLETLAAEDALEPDGALCRPVDFATGKPLEADRQERIFASSEYVKDGLISVYERFGPAAPIGPRMFEVLDAVLAHSAHASKFGPIPGGGSEVNGNVLQVCSRLSFAADEPSRRAAYATMAARVAEAVTQQMLPACNGLPVRTFDYENGRAVETHIKLRDHGNEVIPGLAEAFAMAVARRGEDPEWAARADRWAKPIAGMMETVLDKGSDANGVPLSGIDTATLTVTDARPSDNWGYVLSGVLLFTRAAREHGALPADRLDALDARADRTAAAVAKLYGVAWEGDGMDGYCDTLESALYVARHRPPSAGVLLPWVDDQIGLLFARQQASGFVGGNYLDGNFIRTTLMYADQKAAGWRVEPFREDVRVGYARSADGRSAALVVAADRPYAGTLVPDPPRHRQHMRLPWDWPRLNSWPEWCELDALAVTGADGLPTTPTADQLRAGLPLDLPANGLVVLRFAR